VPVMPKMSTQIRLDEELYLKVKYLSEHEFRSLNAQLEFLVFLSIKNYEKEHGPIPIEE
jgi:hypothetical protein